MALTSSSVSFRVAAGLRRKSAPRHAAHPAGVSASRRLCGPESRTAFFVYLGKIPIAKAVGAGEGGAGGEDDEIGFELQVEESQEEEEEESGLNRMMRNRRVVRARVKVGAPLEAVWAALTDYEGLPEFIPGLAVSRLIDHRPGEFARLYQVGQQEVALGIKFSAGGVMECYEKPLEVLPGGGGRRREIQFKMVEGDFEVFEGRWRLLQQAEETELGYMVAVEPKPWLPVRLIQGRICREIKSNILAVRARALHIHSHTLHSP